MRILPLAILLIAAPFAPAVAQEAVPPKPTGPLSPHEQRLQGRWNAYDFVETTRIEYAMTFDGRDFRARARPQEAHRDERYRGYVVIRTDVEPAQIDFVVLDAAGEPGRISKGIFRFDRESVIVKAPESGLPRPSDLDSADEGPIAFLRLSRAE